MPTCRVEKSSVPFHSNSSENCDCDGAYQTCYSFNKEQHYEGDFFRDGLHGQGTYKWNDVAVYEGGFYSNYKEGYASLSFPDSSYFEGLFIRNEPFGPGILTHANGRQDAGFWMGRKLVRLSRAVDFIIPRLAPTSAAKLKLLQFRRLIPLNETDWMVATDVLKKCGYPFDHFYSPYSSLIYDPRSVFFDMQAFEETYFVNFKEVLKGFSVKEKSWESLLGIDEELEDEEKSSERLKETPIPPHCLCPQDVFVMEYKDQNPIDVCEERSTEGEYEMGILTYFTKFGTISRLPKNEDEDKSEEEVPGEDIFGGAKESKIKSRPSNIVSWNRSELCTEMLKQIFRYRAFEDKLHFNLGKLMLGVRTAFRRTGIKEKECLQFLKMCSLGPGRVIKDLLCSYEISEELMDARGNNSLMFAAAADQHEVIDILLDYGVDVNTFNDENLTPLNLCLLRRLAQSNGICSWETAFLPKEIDIPASEYPQAEELEAQVSIKSLDRIFGDGMSINDSKSRILDPRLFPPFTSPKAFRDSCDGSHKTYRPSDESKDLFDLSQITILNLPKSQGSQIMIPTIPIDSPPVLRKSYSSTGFQERDECQTIRSSDATPRINIRLVPKSVKRDEFVNSLIKSDTDRYLFEIRFQKNPNMVERKSDDSVKSNRRHSRTLNKTKEEPQEPEPQAVSQDPTFEISKKIADIDKTILKLLTRGADPNISEVPKPAIHLGVYTKDLNTVYNLLSFGANPNSQLYSNEGLLTPLHVVVLQPSSREIVEICELLLIYGAQVESETQPEFSMREEEKDFLDPEKGRTPLQLLCMRPDLEYADPEGNVLRIGTMLAQNSDKRRFYNGHSYLTLAMMFGNIKLLSSFLDSRFFDPNDILENDRGTALHVLVSRELQKKTAFNDSIKMVDLLLAAGANPLKKFKSPKSLQGNCIDYGYREIQAEREARLSNTSKASKRELRKANGKSVKEISGARDTLQDHVKVVEYLSQKSLEMTQKRKHGKKRKRGSSLASEDLKTDEETTSKHKPGKDGKGRTGERVSLLSSEDDKGKKGKDDDGEEGEGKKGKKGKNDDGEEGEGKKGKKEKDEETEEGEGEKRGKKGKDDDGEQGEGKKKGKKGKGDDGEEGDGKKKGKKGKGDDGEGGEGKKKGKMGKGDDGEEREGKKKGKKRKDDETEGEGKKGKKQGEDGTEKSKAKVDKGEKGKKRKAGDDEEGDERGKRGKKNKLKPEEGDREQKESKKAGDVKESVPKMEKESNKDLNKLRERELCLQNSSKPSFKCSSTKQLGARSETFPERLRQDLLRMYGENCINIDINQFLVPYVVLRDGELYYRFHGKKQIQKEQYSLI